jgi:hypothetical protein
MAETGTVTLEVTAPDKRLHTNVWKASVTLNGVLFEGEGPSIRVAIREMEAKITATLRPIEP